MKEQDEMAELLERSLTKAGFTVPAAPKRARKKLVLTERRSSARFEDKTPGKNVFVGSYYNFSRYFCTFKFAFNSSFAIK